MKYLLDSDIVIDNLRGRKAIDLDILDNGAGISIITLAELIYGAHKSKDPKQSLDRISADLVNFDLQVKDLDEQMVSEFGKIKADLEVKGRRLEDFDLLIAATAIVGNLTLVTRNIKHFNRIKGLKLY